MAAPLLEKLQFRSMMAAEGQHIFTLSPFVIQL
jgi:hypothetical protein